MSEQHPADTASGVRPSSAGGLLRQARQAQGLHIAALAAAIKVVPKKLELLEADRFDELPDATFTRALAQSVCRSLKIDPAPVLALLPPLNGQERLEQVAQGLRTPFREHTDRLAPKDRVRLSSPMLWIAGVVVLLTVVVYALPSHLWPTSFGGARLRLPDGAASAADAGPAATDTTPGTVTQTIANPLAEGSPAADAAPVAPTTSSSAASAADGARAEAILAGAPTSAAPPAAASTPAAGADAPLQIRASAAAWVGVTDARGQALIGRVLQPGETVGLDGVAPLKVRIGNVVATELTYRGKAVALARSKDNTARLELK